MPFAVAARKLLAGWLGLLDLASYIVTPIVDILSRLKNALLGGVVKFCMQQM